MDQMSRYVAAVPLPDKSARSVVNAIMTNWISLYGAPATIRMDNDAPEQRGPGGKPEWFLGIILATRGTLIPGNC